jgi:hypothetical protein
MQLGGAVVVAAILAFCTLIGAEKDMVLVIRHEGSAALVCSTSIIADFRSSI